MRASASHYAVSIFQGEGRKCTLCFSIGDSQQLPVLDSLSNLPFLNLTSVYVHKSVCAVTVSLAVTLSSEFSKCTVLSVSAVHVEAERGQQGRKKRRKNGGREGEKEDKGGRKREEEQGVRE